VRAHLLLPLAAIGLSSLCWGSTIDTTRRVRVSIDDSSAPSTVPGPRRIRGTLDEVGITPALHAPSVAAFPLDEGPASEPRQGRLIRLSLEEGHTVYGRLSESRAHRYVRTSLD